MTPLLNRREWLAGTAGLASAYALRRSLAQAADSSAKKSGYIDAHVHVWTPDVERYPLAAGFTREKMKPPSFTPEQLFDEARPCGVERIVLIQMSFYRFDNSYMLDTIRRFPGVFSGVGIVDDTVARPQDAMRALAKQGVRGFRISPGKQPPDAWLATAGMQAMWQCGAEDGLAVCPLIGPDVLPAVDRMCEKFPKTTVVIDHFSRIGMDGTIRETDLDRLCRIARFPQTHVKTSAFYAMGKKQAPYLDLGPMIQRLLGAYGRERLMWASDCPFQVQNGHDYRSSIELITDKLAFLSTDDKEWLLRKTAEKVFFG